eukprot:g6289.t1
MRAAPAQCAHRCDLTPNASAADYLLYPAHALDPGDAAALDAALPPRRGALLVCQEPWCHGWANRSHPRVAAVVGYHRNFDFWLPNRCPEILDLATRGAPPPAGSAAREGRGGVGGGGSNSGRGAGSEAARVAAFVSNCNTPVRHAVLEMLMRMLPVDSYGQCLRNANFSAANPVEHGYFGAQTYLQKHRAARRYPFVVAMENTELFDYVTEKVFDAYYAGAVPIYLGAPNIAEYVPGLHSLLLVRSFSAPVVGKPHEELLRMDLLAAEIRRLLAVPEELRRKHQYAWAERSPVVRRCREVARLGSIIPPSARLVREERQYDRMAYTFCGACEAARAREGLK